MVSWFFSIRGDIGSGLFSLIRMYSVRGLRKCVYVIKLEEK